MNAGSKVGKVAMVLSFVAALNLHATDDKNTKLEKTIVTSTGFETQLKDEVKNAYIITSEEIKDRGYTSVREVLERSPGVYIKDSGDAEYEEIDMRGQGGRYSKTNVKTLVNGMSLNVLKAGHGNINTPFNLIPVEDIERIEIIPGGGSVLYGGGTPGGIINIITKKNPSDFYARASSKIGSYSYKDATLSIGGLATDNLFLSFSAKGFDTKHYREGQKTTGYHFGGAINYQINDNQSITVTPNFFSQKLENSADYLTKKQVEQNRRQVIKPGDPSKYSKFDISLDYAINFTENFETRIMPYYLKTKFDREGAYIDSYTKKPKSYHDKFSDTKFGVKLKNRLKYSSGEFIFGYEYEDIYDKLTQNDKLGKAIHSIYFLEKHNFTDWFSLSGGARYERAIYDVQRPESKRLKRAAFSNQKNTNSTAFELIPNFKYSDTGNVYLKFEQGFVSPSPQELVDVATVGKRTQFQFNNLKPEKFKTYEAGFKDMFFGQFVSATLFKTDTTDMIFLRWKDPAGHGVSQSIYDREYINLDQAKRHGVELYSEQYLLSDKLKLSESFSYVKSKATYERKGKKVTEDIPFVAKRKFVFSVDYSPIKSLNIYTDFKYYSKILNYSGEYMNSKTIVDLSAKYNFTKNFSVNGGIKNLFDKKYYSFYDTKANKGEGQYYPSPERNFYIEFKYNY
ncbi:TonB-dependent receptor [Campylobacter sp. RM16187]|uniref:TonB-dependent receptor n=1 Tax=Campylobacter sp. RM16187 TaxID=1660063 RepID=UPI0021B5FA60|nr:TonB-dependent receptor [Campylobacter sp. RM16187]QKG29702.1 TonB-dependent receptor [Campylobacter sp. RM16187]